MNLEGLEVKVSSHDILIEGLQNRIDGLEETTKRIEALTLSVEKMAMSLERMTQEQADQRQKQNQLADRLIEVEKQPYMNKADKYERLISYLVTLVLGAVVGYLLKNLFGI